MKNYHCDIHLLVIKDYVNVNYKLSDTNIESMYLIFTIN